MKSFREFYINESTQISEASLGRLNQHLEDGDAVAIVSACRSERTDAENKAKTNELRRRVLGMHFGYNKAVGGYTETLPDGSTSDKVQETSTIIYASPEREKELFRLAFQLGEDFDQECILFIHKNKNAEWVYTTNTRDHSKGDVEKLGKFYAQQMGAYFTKIGKRSFSFVVESDDINSFNDTNGEIKLKGVAEAAMFEYDRKKLKQEADEFASQFDLD